MPRTTLITDIDNTLYDWFHMWYQSFSAMLGEVKRISGLSEAILLPEYRAIHQKYRTSEYAFLLEELPCLQAAFPGQDLTAKFDDAVHAYRSARRTSLALYEGVKETLAELRAAGVLIVIYTESLAFYTNFRIRRLELDDLVDFIFSPPDHALPGGVVGHTQNDTARLLHAQHRYLPAGVIKPDPAVLLDIVKEVNRAPAECLYLGDSLMRDVAMAQDAEFLDAYAEYGGVQHREEYELLRQVSHWTEEDVQREKAITTRSVRPTHKISRFSEIKQFF